MEDIRRKESPRKYVERIAWMRDYMRSRLSKERKSRRLSNVHHRLTSETAEERYHRFCLIKKRITNETAEEREHRLFFIPNRRLNESDEKRSKRLSKLRKYANKRIMNETTNKRIYRLQRVREIDNKRRHSFNKSDFKKAINIFWDVLCTICKKTQYPQQRFNLDTSKLSSIVPSDLVELKSIVACSRCTANLSKRKIPSQAFWYKLVVSPVPEDLANISDIEHRLLSRIIPHLKIIKVDNRFSQHWCKGQVILFALDVSELAEQLPLQLNRAGIVIVAGSLENLQYIGEVKVDIHKLKLALQ